MAPGTAPEETVRFLISCIRHSVSGKIDFAAVATECSIVSKAAAAKRYERLLKANDIKPSDVRGKANTGDAADGAEDGDEEATPVATPKAAKTSKTTVPKSSKKKSPAKAKTPTTPASKKRKVEDVKMEETAADEEVEDEEMETPSKSIFGNGEDGVAPVDTEV